MYGHALSVAIGGALGNAVWASVAFFGISPFQKYRYLEAGFLALTALVTFTLGILALRQSRYIMHQEYDIIERIRRKRWALLKGLTMVLVNPLGIVSWMILLQFLRKSKIFIPLQLRYEIPFALIVAAGAFTYFSLIIAITNKIKDFFSDHHVSKIVRIIGFFLICLSLYFLYHSLYIFTHPESSRPSDVILNQFSM